MPADNRRTSIDQFEQRVLAKSKQGSDRSVDRRPSSDGSQSSVSSFEKRLLHKTKSEDSLRSSSQRSADDFQRRIQDKMKSGGATAAAAAASRRDGAGDASPTTTTRRGSFEERLARKMSDEGSSDRKLGGGKSSRSPSPAMDNYERRIQDKLKGGGSSRNNLGRSSSRSPSPAMSGGADDFQRKIEEKMKSGGGSSTASAAARRDSGYRSASPSVGTRRASFEERLAKKMSSEGGSQRSFDNEANTLDDFETRVRNKSAAGGGGSSSRAVGKMDKSKLDDFEKRVRDKSQASSRELGNLKSADLDDSADRKRAAIKELMQDEYIDPHERQKKLQAIMAGDWNDSERSSSEFGSSGHLDGQKEAALALERKIQAKLKNRKDNEREHRNLYDSPSFDEEDGVEVDLKGGIYDDDDDDDPERMRSLTISDSGRDIVRSDHAQDGVGYGSLPLPEEHFPTDADVESSPLAANAEPTFVEDVNDENYGLAVAQAISPDDQPDYVYAAIEYDPDSKPPLHRNRRFRAYTYLALILIASEFEWCN